MIYLTTIRRGSGHGVDVADYRDDLTARRAAQANPQAVEVETRDGRVVWRRVPEKEKADG